MANVKQSSHEHGGVELELFTSDADFSAECKYLHKHIPGIFKVEHNGTSMELFVPYLTREFATKMYGVYPETNIHHINVKCDGTNTTICNLHTNLTIPYDTAAVIGSWLSGFMSAIGIPKN